MLVAPLEIFSTVVGKYVEKHSLLTLLSHFFPK